MVFGGINLRLLSCFFFSRRGVILWVFLRMRLVLFVGSVYDRYGIARRYGVRKFIFF